MALKFIIVFVVSLLSVSVLWAQERSHLQQDLDKKKEAWSAKAPESRKKIYNDGIKTVGSSGVMETALKKGDKIPAFEMTNASGEMVSSKDLLENGPVVMIWYRGGWCPYCNLQLRAMQEWLPKFEAEGAQLVAVSPEIPDSSTSTEEKNNLQFTVLSDRGNVASKKFGIVYKLPDPVAKQFEGRLDVAAYNGDDSLELPLAVAYVVDQEGVIQWAFVDEDYRKRAEPSDILDALKKMNE